MRFKKLGTLVILLITALVLIFGLSNLVYAEALQNSLSVQGYLANGEMQSNDLPYPNPCDRAYPAPDECDYLPTILKLTEQIKGVFGE